MSAPEADHTPAEANEAWTRYLEATKRLEAPLPREHGKAEGAVKRRKRMGFDWYEWRIPT